MEMLSHTSSCPFSFTAPIWIISKISLSPTWRYTALS